MRVVVTGRKRPVWKLLLLWIATFGIQRRVWMHRVLRELDAHEALALPHRLHAFLLASPLVGVAAFAGLMAAGVPVPIAGGVAAAFLLPPAYVTALTVVHTRRMLVGSGLPYGPAPLVAGAAMVPLLGSLFLIAWQQSRLNRFWDHERSDPEGGVELDLDLSGDAEFARALREALQASYHAGSRFDRRRQRRREKVAALRDQWGEVRDERLAVRTAGGSTPVLPWRRPERPPPLRLQVTCACGHAFQAQRDPLAATPIRCPACGLQEVLPGAAPVAT